MKKLSILFFLVILSLPREAFSDRDDHLTPCEDSIQGPQYPYHSLLRQTVLKAHLKDAGRINARYISFYPTESAVTLFGNKREKDGLRLFDNEKYGFRLLLTEAKTKFPSTSDSNLNAMPKIDVFTTELNPETGAIITAVFDKLLLQTHYPKHSALIADGSKYYFGAASSTSGFMMCGTSLSPPSDSSAGRLVKIGKLMKEYAKTKKADVLVELNARAEELLKE